MQSMDLANVKVTTDRFMLRPWQEGDLDVLAQAGIDPYLTSITTVPATYTTDAGYAHERSPTGLPAHPPAGTRPGSHRTPAGQ